MTRIIFKLQIIFGLFCLFFLFVAPSKVLAAECTLDNKDSHCPGNAKSVYITENFSDTVILPGETFTLTDFEGNLLDSGLRVDMGSSAFTVSGASEISYDYIATNGADVNLSGDWIKSGSGFVYTGVLEGQGDSGNVTIIATKVGGRGCYDFIGTINTYGCGNNAGNVTITADYINVGNIYSYSLSPADGGCNGFDECGVDSYNCTFGNAGQITINNAIRFLAVDLRVQGLHPTDINISATDAIDVNNIITYGGCALKGEADDYPCIFRPYTCQNPGPDGYEPPDCHEEQKRTYCADATASGKVSLSANKFVKTGDINTSSKEFEFNVKSGKGGDVNLNVPNGWIMQDPEDSDYGENVGGVFTGKIDTKGIVAGNVTINTGANVKVNGKISTNNTAPEAFPQEISNFSKSSKPGNVNITAGRDMNILDSIGALGKYPFAPDGGDVTLTAGNKLRLYSSIDVSGKSSGLDPWYVIDGATYGQCTSLIWLLNGTNAGNIYGGSPGGSALGKYGDGPRGGNGGNITISARQIAYDEINSPFLKLFANGGIGAPGGNGGNSFYCETLGCVAPAGNAVDYMPVHGYGGKGGKGGNGGNINVNISDKTCLRAIELYANGGQGGKSGDHGNIPGYAFQYPSTSPNNCILGGEEWPGYGWKGQFITPRESNPEAGDGGNAGIISLRAPQGYFAEDEGTMIITSANAYAQGGNGGGLGSVADTGPYPFYCVSPLNPDEVLSNVKAIYADCDCYEGGCEGEHVGDGDYFICDDKIPQTPCGGVLTSFALCLSNPLKDPDISCISPGGLNVAQALEGAFDGRKGAAGGDAGSIDISTFLETGGPLPYSSAGAFASAVSNCDFSAFGGKGKEGSRGQDALVDPPGKGGDSGDGGKGGSITVPGVDTFVSLDADGDGIADAIAGGKKGEEVGPGGGPWPMILPVADNLCASVAIRYTSWGRLCNRECTSSHNECKTSEDCESYEECKAIEGYNDQCCDCISDFCLKSCGTGESSTDTYKIQYNYGITDGNYGNDGDGGTKQEGSLCSTADICGDDPFVEPRIPPCGNGVIDPGEQCEADTHCAANEYCDSNCQCQPSGPECGNNIIEGTEQCDGTADDACPGQCQADCTCPECGNNIIEGTEQCDGTADDACPGQCQADCTCSVPTLSVVLQVATDSSNWQDNLTGTVPLNDVDLKASVSGTAVGTINYKFDCENDGNWDYVFGNISDNPKEVTDACNYSPDGSYTAKVRVERDTAPAVEDTATITVNPVGNNPPSAVISCGDEPDYDCLVYENNPLLLINNSTDLDSTNPPDNDNDIIYSEWFIDGGSIYSCGYAKGCNLTPNNYVGPGPYTAELDVKDKAGALDTAFKNFRIVRDITAGFMCSLDNDNWEVCENLTPLEGDAVYFKDDPSLAEYSKASEKAAINSRIWEKEGINFDSDNNPNPSTIATGPSMTIKLTATDTHNRTASKTHIINVASALPLPEWREIPPF